MARTLAMALSRYEVNALGKSEEVTPSFRQACEFDVLFKKNPDPVSGRISLMMAHSASSPSRN